MTPDMPEEEAIKEFHGDLLINVLEKARELSTQRQSAFTQLALEELVEIGTIGSDFEVCYLRKRLGRGMAKVTGYSISETEARIDLFTTIFSPDENVVSLKQKEFDEAMVQASRVFKFASEKGYEQMEPASSERLMLERLHQARKSVTTLRLILLTNNIAPGSLKDRDIPGMEIACVRDVFDLQRYFRWRTSSKPYESISIDLREHISGPLPCLMSTTTGHEYGAYLAIIPGELLFEIYEKYGGRLMELNVRSYLQNRGKVNKGIRESIINEPHRFLAYNNGISATAESIVVEPSTVGPVITRLEGLQVVNGGQTVASIHRARKVDEADLSNVAVQAKICIISPDLVETLVPQISRFANTQNRVNEADFSANNPFHVEMELLSRKVWTPGEQSKWFYERSRGQYDVLRTREGRTPALRRKFDGINPKKQRFDKTDIAKWMSSWNEQPHVVSLGSQKNFAAFMVAIDSRKEGWLPDHDFFKEVIACGIVFRAAETIARGHRFPAYRANAVCYTVAYLSYRMKGKLDLVDVWRKQEIPHSLRVLLTAWMPDVHREVVKTADNRNVTEWAKKEACWHAIQRLDLQLDDELATQLGLSTPRGPAQHEGMESIMEVGGATWMAIHGWGQRTTELSGAQLGVVRDLATYASAGWRELPSATQCRMALQVLERASSEGLLAEEPP